MRAYGQGQGGSRGGGSEAIESTIDTFGIESIAFITYMPT